MGTPLERPPYADRAIKRHTHEADQQFKRAEEMRQFDPSDSESLQARIEANKRLKYGQNVSREFDGVDPKDLGETSRRIGEYLFHLSRATRLGNHLAVVLGNPSYGPQAEVIGNMLVWHQLVVDALGDALFSNEPEQNKR